MTIEGVTSGPDEEGVDGIGVADFGGKRKRNTEAG
jgi:hypothetical protein